MSANNEARLLQPPTEKQLDENIGQLVVVRDFVMATAAADGQPTFLDDTVPDVLEAYNGTVFTAVDIRVLNDRETDRGLHLRSLHDTLSKSIATHRPIKGRKVLGVAPLWIRKAKKQSSTLIGLIVDDALTSDLENQRQALLQAEQIPTIRNEKPQMPLLGFVENENVPHVLDALKRNYNTGNPAYLPVDVTVTEAWIAFLPNRSNLSLSQRVERHRRSGSYRYIWSRPNNINPVPSSTIAGHRQSAAVVPKRPEPEPEATAADVAEQNQGHKEVYPQVVEVLSLARNYLEANPAYTRAGVDDAIKFLEGEVLGMSVADCEKLAHTFKERVATQAQNSLKHEG
jgi:hypothetical protein